jgi:hypothetical protein
VNQTSLIPKENALLSIKIEFNYNSVDQTSRSVISVTERQPPAVQSLSLVLNIVI